MYLKRVPMWLRRVSSQCQKMWLYQQNYQWVKCHNRKQGLLGWFRSNLWCVFIIVVLQMDWKELWFGDSNEDSWHIQNTIDVMVRSGIDVQDPIIILSLLIAHIITALFIITGLLLSMRCMHQRDYVWIFLSNHYLMGTESTLSWIGRILFRKMDYFWHSDGYSPEGNVPSSVFSLCVFSPPMVEVSVVGGSAEVEMVSFFFSFTFPVVMIMMLWQHLTPLSRVHD